MNRPTVAITNPETPPAARIGITPRSENGCGPRRVMAAKAPRVIPVTTVLSRVGRRMMYTTICARLGSGGGGRRRGGSGGTTPAPRAVGGHRGGSASWALASVASGISSVAVIATITVRRPNESRISCVVRRPPSRQTCSLSSGRRTTAASCAG